jgi:hypothetical protein
MLSDSSLTNILVVVMSTLFVFDCSVTNRYKNRAAYHKYDIEYIISIAVDRVLPVT